MYLNILHEYNRDLYETKACFKFFVKKIKKKLQCCKIKEYNVMGKKLSKGKRVQLVHILQNIYSPS